MYSNQRFLHSYTLYVPPSLHTCDLKVLLQATLHIWIQHKRGEGQAAKGREQHDHDVDRRHRSLLGCGASSIQHDSSPYHIIQVVH